MMRPWLLAILSGLLLFTAFPPLEWAPAAWTALVPLLWAAASVAPGKAFRLGLLAGLVFWWASIAWLARVSWPGWLILGAYCALFAAVFAWLASWTLRAGLARGWTGRLGALACLPACWTALEYLRSNLFTGFAWNPLGATQAGTLPLIQCAAWGGVYAVSFLVVLGNAALVLALLAGPSIRPQKLPAAVGGRLLPPAVALAAIALVWAGGSASLRRPGDAGGVPLRVALIQLNIPQFEKLVEECFGVIELRLRRSTEAAIARHRPELVIWPETAVPTFARGVASTERLIADLLTLGVPLLVGTMDFEPRGETYVYFNSSFLYDPERGLARSYAKQHLVCFGEYVPFGDLLPFLKRLTPIEESFVPGRVQTLFRLDASARVFAVLICFEDTVAALARKAVRTGARLLVNQTNDAWFDPSPASRQHMLQCVFRCVENRVPAVRAANTGITCFIEPTGCVAAALPPGDSPGFQPACLARTVNLPGPDMPLTFYTRHGDVFAGICTGLTFLLAGAVLLRRRRGRNGPAEAIGDGMNLEPSTSNVECPTRDP